MNITEEKLREIEILIKSYNDENTKKFIEAVRVAGTKGDYDEVGDDYDFVFDYQEWLDFS